MPTLAALGRSGRVGNSERGAFWQTEEKGRGGETIRNLADEFTYLDEHASIHVVNVHSIVAISVKTQREFS